MLGIRTFQSLVLWFSCSEVIEQGCVGCIIRVIFANILESTSHLMWILSYRGFRNTFVYRGCYFLFKRLMNLGWTLLLSRRNGQRLSDYFRHVAVRTIQLKQSTLLSIAK